MMSPCWFCGFRSGRGGVRATGSFVARSGGIAIARGCGARRNGMEAPPMASARNPRALGAVRGGAGARRCRVRPSVAVRRLAGAGPASSPLRRSVLRHAVARCRSKRRKGRFRVGTFVPGITDCLRGSFGAGFEPATLGVLIRCSTHLSYPVATCRIRTDDPRTLCPLLYLAELTSLFETPLAHHGIRHGRAARTGRDANPCRCGTFDRCFALASVTRRQFVRAHAPYALRSPTAPPVPKHPDTAPRGASTALPLRRANARGCFGVGWKPLN